MLKTSVLKFLPFFSAFLIIGTVERIISTFSDRGTKATKYIYYRWTFYITLFTYIFIALSSVLEHIMVVKVVNLTISIFGFLIFFVGVLLRRKSIADLGNNWSFHIEIKENHELITNGIYKLFKHPYYLAVIFELIGVCLIANAFYSVVFIFLIQIPLLLIRIFLEEKALIGYFGNEYKRYRIGKIL